MYMQICRQVLVHLYELCRCITHFFTDAKSYEIKFLLQGVNFSCVFTLLLWKGVLYEFEIGDCSYFYV